MTITRETQGQWFGDAAAAANSLGYEIESMGRNGVVLIPVTDAHPQLPVARVTITGAIDADTLRRVLRPPTEAEQP